MKKMKKCISGFSLVEMVIIVGIISTLSGLIVPSFLNWIRIERINAYTRELKEYFRIVRLEARRWGTTCFIDINPISYNYLSRGQDSYGYTVNCRYSIDPNSSEYNESNIGSLAPKINNNIFQVINDDFQVTPNGRISSDQSIVVVIGSRYYQTGPKFLSCLVIKSPTGHINKGRFIAGDMISSNMDISQKSDNNLLIPDNCISN